MFMISKQKKTENSHLHDKSQQTKYGLWHLHLSRFTTKKKHLLNGRFIRTTWVCQYQTGKKNYEF